MVSTLSNSTTPAPQNTKPIPQEDFGRIEEQIFEAGMANSFEEESEVRFRPGDDSATEPAFYSLYGSGKFKMTEKRIFEKGNCINHNNKNFEIM